MRPVISKTFRIAALRADEDEVAVVAAQPLQPAHQDAESGGIEEVDPFEVDDDLVLPIADQLNEAFAELGGGVDVDFARYAQHGPTVAFADVETEIHEYYSSPLFGLTLPRWSPSS